MQSAHPVHLNGLMNFWSPYPGTWAEHVARMGEGSGMYRVLVGKPEGKRPLGRPTHRWEDTIKKWDAGVQSGSSWFRIGGGNL
jgi:hypothetical protein